MAAGERRGVRAPNRGWRRVQGGADTGPELGEGLGDGWPHLVPAEHRDLDEGQVRGGGRGSGPETSGEAGEMPPSPAPPRPARCEGRLPLTTAAPAGSGTGPPAPREGGDAEAGAAVHRDSHRLPAQGPAGRPVPSLGWGPWPGARVWPSFPPPSQARAPPPKLPAAPGPGPPPGTTIIPADKVAFGTTAWPLTVGGSRAGRASPPPALSRVLGRGGGQAVSPADLIWAKATHPSRSPSARALQAQALHLMRPLDPPGCPAQDGRRRLTGRPLSSHSPPPPVLPGG